MLKLKKGEKCDIQFIVKVSCRTLLNKQELLLSNCSLFALLYSEQKSGQWTQDQKTETIINNPHPNFSQEFTIDFNFHEYQRYKVEIRDQKENQCDIIGVFIFNIASLLCCENQTVTSDLLDSQQKKKFGNIILQIHSINQVHLDTIKFKCELDELVKLNKKQENHIFNCFLRFNLYNDETGNYDKIFESETQLNTSTPQFSDIQFSLKKLTSEDKLKPIILEVWDKQPDKQVDLIGTCRFNISLLQNGLSDFKLYKKNEQTIMKSGEFAIINNDKIKLTGVVKVSKFQIKSRSSYLDFFKQGSKTKTILGIDFSQLNGIKGKPNYLHQVSQPTQKSQVQQPNQYQILLNEFLKFLFQYSEKQSIECYGISAKPKFAKYSLNEFQNQFNLSGDQKVNFAQSYEELIQFYANSSNNTEPGPALNIAQFLAYVEEQGKAIKSNTQDSYILCLLLVSGEPTDLEQGFQKLINTSQLPISYLIIGFGNNNFNKLSNLKQEIETRRPSELFCRPNAQFALIGKFQSDQIQQAKKYLMDNFTQQLVDYYQYSKIPFKFLVQPEITSVLWPPPMAKKVPLQTSEKQINYEEFTKNNQQNYSSIELRVGIRNFKAIQNQDSKPQKNPQPYKFGCQINVYLKKNQSGWQKYLYSEVIYNNYNPNFLTAFTIEYQFELKQEIKFEVINPINNEMLGFCETTVGQIVGSEYQVLIKQLVGNKNQKTAKLVIKFERILENNNVYQLQWSAISLKYHEELPTDFKFNPFLRFSINQDKTQVITHETEFIRNTTNPTWKQFEISANQLCMGEVDRPIKVECRNRSIYKEQQIVFGQSYINLNMLESGRQEYGIYHPLSQTFNGKLKLENGLAWQLPSFLEYLKSGVQLKPIFAIDFSINNGKQNVQNQQSLHGDPKSPSTSTIYTQVIKAVLEILSCYQYKKSILAYGFGGRIKTQNQKDKSTFFQFTTNNNNLLTSYEQLCQIYCNLVPQIESLPNSQLSDLTQDLIKQIKSQNSGKITEYAVLFVLLAGEIEDIDKMMELLDEREEVAQQPQQNVTATNSVKDANNEGQQSGDQANKLPLSIVFVNLQGREIQFFKQFSQMSKEATISKKVYRKAACFNLEALQKQINVLTALALSKIPSQLQDFFSSNQIPPLEQSFQNIILDSIVINDPMK